MGKGDIRTKRGKIIRGTFGKTRPRKRKKAYVPETKAEEASEGADDKKESDSAKS